VNVLTFSKMRRVVSKDQTWSIPFRALGSISDATVLGYACITRVCVYLILPAGLGPGVHSASNRNEYQKQKNNVSGEYSAAGA
jgi:hypothetical protein